MAGRALTTMLLPAKVCPGNRKEEAELGFKELDPQVLCVCVRVCVVCTPFNN